jgi:hypothetical protein
MGIISSRNSFIQNEILLLDFSGFKIQKKSAFSPLIIMLLFSETDVLRLVLKYEE